MDRRTDSETDYQKEEGLVDIPIVATGAALHSKLCWRPPKKPTAWNHCAWNYVYFLYNTNGNVWETRVFKSSNI